MRISELLLGPVSDDFEFAPKHKSNSYGPEVGGGGLDEFASNG